MGGAARWVLGLLLLAAPLRAEIYRCEEPGGGLRFTSDPAACERAVAHSPRGAVQGLDAADPPAASAPGAAADPEGEADPPRRWRSGDLAALFAPVSAAAWEVIHEAPENADLHPGLAAQGLRGSQARHYTRARGPVSEVCTVEIWVFETAGQAAAAGAAFEREGWYRVVEGELLVLAHGVRLERNVGSREGLVSGCTVLADATRERAGRARRAR